MVTLGGRTLPLLMAGALLMGCSDDGGDPDESGPSSRVTIEDPAGDQWKPKGGASQVNVDLVQMTAAYREDRLVVEVSYAEPFRKPWISDTYLSIGLDNGPDYDDDYRLDAEWYPGSEKVHVVDSESIAYYCHARAEQALDKGRVTITFRRGCLGSGPRRPVELDYVSSASGPVQDDMFASDGEEHTEAPMISPG